MILQRLATSIRKQDWFTVLIETLIVVLGVFLGLQVNNWNEARIERGVEVRILERLHEEIPALIALRTPDRQFAEMRRGGLKTAVRKLYDAANEDGLNPLECMSVTLSHIYSIPPDDLPIIAELLSTGRMDAIRSEAVRRALSSFILARNSGRQTQAAVSLDIRQLSIQFPDMIASGYAIPDDEGEPEPQPVCKADAMRASPAFLSTLVSNNQRFQTYFQALYEDVDVELEALRSVVEREVGEGE